MYIYLIFWIQLTALIAASISTPAPTPQLIMSTDPVKAAAYSRYRNCTTEGSKIILPGDSSDLLSDDFTNYVNGYVPVDPNSIDLSVYPADIVASKQDFHKTACSTLFHTINGVYSPPQSGEALQMLRLEQLPDKTFRFRHINLQDSFRDYAFAEPNQAKSAAIMFDYGSSGAILKHTAYRTTTGGMIWHYQMLQNSRIVGDYYLVPVTSL